MPRGRERKLKGQTPGKRETHLTTRNQRLTSDDGESADGVSTQTETPCRLKRQRNWTDGEDDELSRKKQKSAYDIAEPGDDSLCPTEVESKLAQKDDELRQLKAELKLRVAQLAELASANSKLVSTAAARVAEVSHLGTEMAALKKDNHKLKSQVLSQWGMLEKLRAQLRDIERRYDPLYPIEKVAVILSAVYDARLRSTPVVSLPPEAAHADPQTLRRLHEGDLSRRRGETTQHISKRLARCPAPVVGPRPRP